MSGIKKKIVDNMKEIKLTVVSPTYNRQEDLENLIKSFLTQDYSSAELLIIDDCGSPKTADVVKKWIKKSKNIIYHKNKKNLGVTANIRNSFELAKGDVIVFMGDDDIFVDDKALSFIAKAFDNNKVGVAKASQILFKDGKLSQAFPLKNSEGGIIYYSGKEIYEKIWFESISFTGLAFKNNQKIRNLVTDSKTLFPQVELAGLASLFFDFAEINRHLVGVQSYSSRQLNPIFYNIEGTRTNILIDWFNIYECIKLAADKNKIEFIARNEFRKKFTKFILIFLPFNSRSNGIAENIKLIASIMRYNKEIILSPFFWISSLISFFPGKIISFWLELVKKIKLRKQIKQAERVKIGQFLSKYY